MKGIIVLDEIPKDCSKCLFNKGLNVCEIMKYTQKKNMYHTYTTDKQVLEEMKPDWCPIKPMPERKMCTMSICISADEYNKRKGFNSCIDEITGEK